MSSLDAFNPATGQIIETLGEDPPDQIEQRICAAHEAQPVWAQRTAEESGEILYRWHGCCQTNWDLQLWSVILFL